MGSNVSHMPKCGGQYMVMCFNCAGRKKKVLKRIFPANKSIHFRSFKDVLNDIYVFFVESLRAKFRPPRPCLYFEQYSFRSLRKVTPLELIESIDSPLDIVSNAAHLDGCCFVCTRRVTYTVRVSNGNSINITYEQ